MRYRNAKKYVKSFQLHLKLISAKFEAYLSEQHREIEERLAEFYADVSESKRYK